MLEKQSLIHSQPFDFFCSNRDTISKRYCKLCAMYLVAQYALKRHKKENICKTKNVESWLLDEDLYTRYPIVARALGLVRARAKESCIQDEDVHCSVGTK